MKTVIKDENYAYITTTAHLDQSKHSKNSYKCTQLTLYVLEKKCPDMALLQTEQIR